MWQAKSCTTLVRLIHPEVGGSPQWRISEWFTTSSEPVNPDSVEAQVRVVILDFSVRAAMTGMLAPADNVNVVANFGEKVDSRD